MVAAQMVTTQVGSGPGQRNPQHPAYRPETEGGGMLHWLGQHFLEVLSFLGGDVRQVSAMCAPVVGKYAPRSAYGRRQRPGLPLRQRGHGGPARGLPRPPPAGPTGTWCTSGLRGDAYWPGLGSQLVVNSRAPSWAGSPTRSYEFALRPRAGVYGNSEWMFQVAVDFVRCGRGAPGGGPRRGHARAAADRRRLRRSATQRWVSSLRRPETP